MNNRVNIPKHIETELLHLSSRRCSLCFGLYQDLEEKEGQIAHLDHDRTNNKINNLIWLCLKHHSNYDSTTSQHKNYTNKELKKYRDELYKIIKEKRNQIVEADITYEIANGYYERFSQEYIGRDESIKHVLEFLNNPNQHFMLLFGVGGMGKSHLLTECWKKFSSPALIRKECNSNYNLKTLFHICKIPYPENIEEAPNIQHLFLDEFCNRDLILILDDFYEVIDKDFRAILPKISKLPNGKILLASRVIPKELIQTGLQVNSYEIPPLGKEDFKTFIRNYVQSEDKVVSLIEQDLNKIYTKAQGYPLGGQLIIDLLDMEESLDDILKDLPKFQAKRDPEGKEFSGRLLDNIFKKGSKVETNLLCEFSALYEASQIDVIKKLPSYDFNAFETLVKRRRFIQKETDGSFHCHAMIKDFAYEKLSNKEVIHDAIGKHYEQVLFSKPTLNSEILYKTINHYKQIGIRKLKSFGGVADQRFKIADVKSLIKDDIKDTIRNYKSLLDVYPEKVAYWNELGMAYRANNQYQLAIDTLRKVVEEIDPKHVPSYNELGITYRANNQYQLAIEAFQKGLKVEPENVRILNELGITYRENGNIENAIKYCYYSLKVEPNNFHTILNLLQIHLFFEPDKNKAINYYERVNRKNRSKTFKRDLKRYKLFIDRLSKEDTINIDEWNEVDERYLYYAIYYKAYNTALSILFKLNEKFPNTARTISLLGKTLCNKLICRNEEGREFLLRAIELFESKGDMNQLLEHIFFYFYNLLNDEEFEILDKEINHFKKYIENLPAFFRFLGNYSKQLDKPEDETIGHFEKAIAISPDDEEKVKSINSLLNYLTNINGDKLKKRIEQLKENLRQISPSD